MFTAFVAAALAQPADPEPFPLDFPIPEPAPAPAPAPAPYPVSPAPYPVSPAPYPVAPAPYAPGAEGQQPPPAPVQRISQDPVFLAPIQPMEPSLEPEARRLDQVLRAWLQPRYNVYGVESVPPWPDYDAGVYMAACPEGQYSGCALVCGDRIQSRWTVGGTLTRTGTGVNVDLVFIGNRSSRELLQFGVALTGGDDPVLTASADTILRKIVEGAFAAVDLRVLDGDPREQEKLRKAQNDVIASSLAELERQKGAVQRQETEVEQTKLTKQQIDQMRTGEQVKPWEAVNMSESEYRRYRNSGKSLDTWRALRRGRLGQAIVRVGIGGGSGPYGQFMDGRYAVDGPNVLELQQFQFVSQSPHFHGDFEVGFGVLPFLDITAHYALRQSQFKYQINQEQVGNPVFLDPEVQRAKGSWSVGGRLNFVPLQVSPVRPSLTAGILYWQGTSWQYIFGGIQAFQPMSNMSMVAAQFGPGVEIDTGRYVNVFVRALVDLPISASTEVVQQGGNTLVMPANPDDFKTANLGITVQAGLVGRLTLIKGGTGKSGRGSAISFEEEEEGL